MSETLIRGRLYDHGKVEIRLNGKTYELVKEIKYKSTREIGKARGTSPLRRGKTRGTIDFEGSIVLYKSPDGGFDQIVEDFGPGWMEKEFDIIVTYGDDGDPITVDELLGCEFLTDEGGTSEGSDPAEVSLDLDISSILRNGKPPLKGMI
jgi:hypothetical protein